MQKTLSTLVKTILIFTSFSPALLTYQYNVEIAVTTENDRERIKLPNEKKELKEVLRFLDEDYYSGPITDIRYLTNSKKKVRK